MVQAGVLPQTPCFVVAGFIPARLIIIVSLISGGHKARSCEWLAETLELPHGHKLEEGLSVEKLLLSKYSNPPSRILERHY
jgi:hypothetical protein